jgi:hypothetical protein
MWKSSAVAWCDIRKLVCDDTVHVHVSAERVYGATARDIHIQINVTWI